MPDGLTAKIVKIRMNSPLASMLHYSELSVMPIPFAQKLKAIINYWRFSFYAKNTFISKVRQIGVFALVMYPFGLLYHLKDLHFMKILHVITTLYTGGAEKLMVDLLPRMKQAGHKVELCVFDGTRTPFFLNSWKKRKIRNPLVS